MYVFVMTNPKVLFHVLGVGLHVTTPIGTVAHESVGFFANVTVVAYARNTTPVSSSGPSPEYNSSIR